MASNPGERLSPDSSLFPSSALQRPRLVLQTSPSTQNIPTQQRPTFSPTMSYPTTPSSLRTSVDFQRNMDGNTAKPVPAGQGKNLAASMNSSHTQPLTPPLTPAPEKSYFNASHRLDQSLQSLWNSSLANSAMDGTLVYRKNHFGECEEFGRGSWSIVRAAILHESGTTAQHAYATPPSSSSPPGRLVAVKSPLRNDAVELLKNEARILEFLHPKTAGSRADAATYVVRFFGFEQSTVSLALEALPLTLEDYSKSCLKTACQNLSTRTMFSPVIGESQWRQMAKQLIKGLGFLHSRKIIHGDIKPANILLRPRPSTDAANPFTSENGSVTTYDPVYCDFSSSRFDDPSVEASPVSAMTTCFTAPELLSALSKSATAQLAVTTYKCDVFSLGVALITPAIGSGVYDGLRMEMQRLSLAKEGKPLDIARGSDQASRIMKNSFVFKSLLSAVAKDPEARCTTSEWLSSFENLEQQDC